MVEKIAIDDVTPIIVGPGCTRRDLPTCGKLRTWVVDIAPGAQWPHVDQHDIYGEQVFIISGEMIDGDHVFKPGDYVCFGPNSSHQPRSETGVRLYGMNALPNQ